MASNRKINNIRTLSKKEFEFQLDHEEFEVDDYSWENLLHKEDFELINEEHPCHICIQRAQPKSGTRFSLRLWKKTNIMSMLACPHREVTIEIAEDEDSYINWTHEIPNWFERITTSQSVRKRKNKDNVRGVMCKKLKTK